MYREFMVGDREKFVFGDGICKFFKVCVSVEVLMVGVPLVWQRGHEADIGVNARRR